MIKLVASWYVCAVVAVLCKQTGEAVAELRPPRDLAAAEMKSPLSHRPVLNTTEGHYRHRDSAHDNRLLQDIPLDTPREQLSPYSRHFAGFFPTRGVRSIPLNVTATDIKRTTVTLSWTAPLDRSGLKGYRLLIARVDGGFETIAAVSGDVYSYVYGGLLPGTVYRLVIEAMYYDGVGSPLVVSVTTLPYTDFTQAPSAPPSHIRLSVTNSSLLTVSWDLCPGASHYSVLQSWKNELATLATTSADSYTTQLQQEMVEDVVFFVYSANSVGRSALSMQFLYVPQEDMGIPSKPTNLLVQPLANDVLTLQWKHPFGEVRINEYICSALSNETGVEIVARVSTVSTVCSLRGVTGGVRYTFAVTAVNSVSTSAPAEITVTMPDATLKAPSDLTASVINGTSIQLAWNGVQGAAGYVIYNVLEDMVFLLSEVPETMHTVEDVPTGVTLQYQVSAMDVIGREGLRSAVVMVEVPLLPAPDSFQAEKLSEFTYRLSWTAVVGASAYVLEERIAGVLTRNLTATDPSLLLQDLPPGTRISYQVATMDSSGSRGNRGVLSAPLILQTGPVQPGIVSTVCCCGYFGDHRHSKEMQCTLNQNTPFG